VPARAVSRPAWAKMDQVPTVRAIVKHSDPQAGSTRSEKGPSQRVDKTPAQARFLKALARLGSVWSVPRLPAMVSIVVSSRLTRSLGRADVRQWQVTLAADLPGAGAFVEEVLCHELAHIVAFDLVGNSERTHGPTWQRLVREAGFVPSRRLESPANRRDGHARTPKRRFVHRCSVCGFTRIASRRNPGWRCGDCMLAGLDGRFDIFEMV
jgi:hypothetical protein